jgi:hypothetical protein
MSRRRHTPEQVVRKLREACGRRLKTRPVAPIEN